MIIAVIIELLLAVNYVGVRLLEVWHSFAYLIIINTLVISIHIWIFNTVIILVITGDDLIIYVFEIRPVSFRLLLGLRLFHANRFVNV